MYMKCAYFHFLFFTSERYRRGLPGSDDFETYNGRAVYHLPVDQWKTLPGRSKLFTMCKSVCLSSLFASHIYVHAIQGGLPRCRLPKMGHVKQKCTITHPKFSLYGLL